jgi:uncharacterized membrane protein
MKEQKQEEINADIQTAQTLSMWGNHLMILGFFIGIAIIVLGIAVGSGISFLFSILYIILAVVIMIGGVILKFLFETISTLTINIVRIRENTDKELQEQDK